MKSFINSLIALAVAAVCAIASKAHAIVFDHMGRSGLVLGVNGIPTAEDFAAYRVTNPGQSEVVRQRLYDYNLYPTAGATLLSFFSQTQGQGLATALGTTAGSGKTALDTNQEMPNTLPSGKSYMIESIEVLFFPGSVSTANTYTPANVSVFAVAAAATVTGAANDVNTFYQSGMLQFNVLSKNYLQETPLMAFPPKANLDTSAALSSNSATVGSSGMSVTKAVGRAYYLEPQVVLQPAVNFELKLIWPALVPTPSGFNARVGVIFDGFLMRASQ